MPVVPVSSRRASSTTQEIVIRANDDFDLRLADVTIDYEEEGYVEDTDAAEINYDELLEQMQEDTRAASRERLAAGYEEIELIGCYLFLLFLRGTKEKPITTPFCEVGSSATLALN